MEQALALLQAHGVLAVALAVFAKRMGVPVPALPFLLLAGARGAGDGVFALAALAAGTVASVLADQAWFLGGRWHGRKVLALMCRISVSPGSCIRKSEVAFARRGALTVLFAKFIPAVAGLAPPLAGALGMGALNFALLNAAGTVLWVGSGIAAGLVFHRQVASVLQWLQALGSAALPYLLLAVALYLGWLLLRRLVVHLIAARAPRIQPRALAELLARGEEVLLVDVRGAGFAPDDRLPGAVRSSAAGAELDRLAALGAPRLVTYCDCPDDTSAALTALELMKRGSPACVLAGGVDGWRAAGLPLHHLAPPAVNGVASGSGEVVTEA